MNRFDQQLQMGYSSTMNKNFPDFPCGLALKTVEPKPDLPSFNKGVQDLYNGLVEEIDSYRKALVYHKGELLNTTSFKIAWTALEMIASSQSKIEEVQKQLELLKQLAPGIGRR